MLEPVSTLSIAWLGFASLNAYARRGNGVSAEADALRDAATAVVESIERSQMLFGGKAASISSLRALANECLETGWNGEGASPVNPVAVAIAEEFIRVFPDGLPLPEFSIDPDGSVSLDWIQSRTRLFSLSIGATNRLAYAWLDGTDRGHGVARFTGDRVPQRIVEGIGTIINYGNAVVGAR